MNGGCRSRPVSRNCSPNRRSNPKPTRRPTRMMCRERPAPPTDPALVEAASCRFRHRVHLGGSVICTMQLANLRPVAGGDLLDDEIYDRLPVPGAERIMSLAFFFDDRDLPAEFLVALLGDPGLAFEPGVEAAADMQDRHA